MDQEYLIARMRASLAMARSAAESAARLVHFELAGRYSLAVERFPPGDREVRCQTDDGGSFYHKDAG